MADAAREIENLLYTYAERIDGGDLEGLADLFAHGRIRRRRRSAATAIVGARQGARALPRFDAALPGGTPRTKHVTSNAIVEVEEGASTGSARSYYTVFQRPTTSRSSRSSRAAIATPSTASTDAGGSIRA